MQNNFYRIADWDVCISFEDSKVNGTHLLASFEPFRIDSPTEPLLFHLHVDDTLQPCPKDKRKRIRAFDTGNGDTVVFKLNEGGYQYIIKDTQGGDCGLLLTDRYFRHCQCALNGNGRMRQFGLNNALMLIFAFAGSHKQTLLLHASLVRQHGHGYAFIAKSGTGKSTQVSMWLRYLKGCDLMNDDNPIVRIMPQDGRVFIYGSPWSGKTPCYRNVKAPLGAITQIVRAKENRVERLKPIEAFTSLLPACSAMKWDSEIFNLICDTITRIIETIPVYTLHCLPNRDAAIVCNKAIAKDVNQPQS